MSRILLYVIILVVPMSLYGKGALFLVENICSSHTNPDLVNAHKSNLSQNKKEAFLTFISYLKPSLNTRYLQNIDAELIDYVLDSYAIKTEKYTFDSYYACYDFWFSYDRLYNKFPNIIHTQDKIMIIPIYSEKDIEVSIWHEDLWSLCQKYLTSDKITILPRNHCRKNAGLLAGLLSDYQFCNFSYLYTDYDVDTVYIIHLEKSNRNSYRIKVIDLATRITLYEMERLSPKGDFIEYFPFLMKNLSNIIQSKYIVDNSSNDCIHYKLIFTDMLDWTSVKEHFKNIPYTIQYFSSAGVVITLKNCNYDIDNLKNLLNNFDITIKNIDNEYLLLTDH
ncbi:MAG: hypothetical protein P857_179 [Candidatus Xenolissoclinum pacificiensis L6]|uniref:Uncharacterized protein n=1 Tax=Candidatus Xenolissoclinum pacificiensis L6 TaxID=1401685 RepID=W2UZD9_9RICK|nr:MAG: hypothetical protein P857_179 [Candidatus Xenolissoclinum pacificiensis L6]